MDGTVFITTDGGSILSVCGPKGLAIRLLALDELEEFPKDSLEYADLYTDMEQRDRALETGDIVMLL